VLPGTLRVDTEVTLIGGGLAALVAATAAGGAADSAGQLPLRRSCPPANFHPPYPPGIDEAVALAKRVVYGQRYLVTRADLLEISLVSRPVDRDARIDAISVPTGTLRVAIGPGTRLSRARNGKRANREARTSQ
jgi:hypothetical protein